MRIMDFLELAKKRYSVRNFDTKQVEQEKVDLILEAGRLAPTACNNQPQRILVLNTKEDMDKLKVCTPFTFDAPLALIVCYDKITSWKRTFDNQDMGIVDASIVATHIILEAANLGLGSTWVGHFDPEKAKTAFFMPENIVPVVVLPIGYLNEISIPNPNHNKRFDLAKTVVHNTFNTQ